MESGLVTPASTNLNIHDLNAFFQTSSKYLLKCVQDLSNASFNKMGDGGPPGSPTPFYGVHGSNRSPKPTSPISPSSMRPQFTIPLNQTNGPMYLPANGPRMYLEPNLLVNKPSDELPPGVDPCQREVGAQPIRLLYQFTGGILRKHLHLENNKDTTGKTLMLNTQNTEARYIKYHNNKR